MMIIKARTEPLTIDLLNAMLANFATGTISLDELWAQIESADEEQDDPYTGSVYNRLPEAIQNRMSNFDREAGI